MRALSTKPFSYHPSFAYKNQARQGIARLKNQAQLYNNYGSICPKISGKKAGSFK
jgi:hypothetical protein